MHDFFPKETAQRQLIAELAAQGREEERERAAWVLADMIMRRTLPIPQAQAPGRASRTAL